MTRRPAVRRRHRQATARPSRARRPDRASSPAPPTSRTSRIGTTATLRRGRGGGRFALTAPAPRRAALPLRAAPPTSPSSCAGAGQSQPAGAQLRHRRRASRPATLIAVEVITPGGNWSSYPAHKHDEATRARVASSRRSTTTRSRPARTASPGSASTAPAPRTRATRRPIDVLVEVRDRDTVLVPHGWHGPCAAAPGHDMYYLNVMAGPGRARLEDHRPPRPGLGARHLGGPADRSPTGRQAS